MKILLLTLLGFILAFVTALLLKSGGAIHALFSPLFIPNYLALKGAALRIGNESPNLFGFLYSSSMTLAFWSPFIYWKFLRKKKLEKK